MKPVTCEHWSAGKRPGDGVCGIGRYGGRPSYGACDNCLGLPIRTDVAVVVTTSDRSKTEGPKRWAEYHRLALAWDGINPEAFAAYRRSLARGMCCSCNADWQQRCDAVPFAATNAAEAFALSVADHNAVNARLKKSGLTLEEARQKWAAALA